mmetsp:Transcript_130096/g.316071  ORF Transcript_130096/g.316071 Transcript_130096/m.316071 type:complete len:334 (+) Transcript_130096:672-1673(+)
MRRADDKVAVRLPSRGRVHVRPVLLRLELVSNRGENGDRLHDDGILFDDFHGAAFPPAAGPVIHERDGMQPGLEAHLLFVRRVRTVKRQRVHARGEDRAGGDVIGVVRLVGRVVHVPVHVFRRVVVGRLRLHDDVDATGRLRGRRRHRRGRRRVRGSARVLADALDVRFYRVFDARASALRDVASLVFRDVNRVLPPVWLRKHRSVSDATRGLVLEHRRIEVDPASAVVQVHAHGLGAEDALFLVGDDRVPVGFARPFGDFEKLLRRRRRRRGRGRRRGIRARDVSGGEHVVHVDLDVVASAVVKNQILGRVRHRLVPGLESRAVFFVAVLEA